MPRRRAPDPHRAVAYLRASTDEQRLGPEAQVAAIDAWALRERIEIVGTHLDQGVSGGSDLDGRPGLVAALATLRAERAGVLLVAKRDRLARDVYVAATIERAVAASGARVVCADGTGNGDTPADAFMRTILDGAAAYERALIAQRTRDALAAKRARGEATGGVPPYGFRFASGRRVEDIEERGLVEEIARLGREGRTIRSIALELARRGVRSPRTGRPLGKTQVGRMLHARAEPATT